MDKMESKKKKVPNLLCATQGEDDGMMSISFYYGLEGMGKHTPIKALFPAIGDIADAFEDIKVKLHKIAKKLCKRERKKLRLHQNVTQDHNTNGSSFDEELLTESNCDIISLSSVQVIEDVGESQSGAENNLDDENTIDKSVKTNNAVNTTEALNCPSNSDEIEPIQNEHQNPKTEVEECMKVVDLRIMDKEKEINTSTSNTDGWKNGHCFVIDICGVVVQYLIYVNPPRIKNIELPKSMMSGFMVYPKVYIENCTHEKCNFKWFKCKKKPKHKMSEIYKQLFFPETGEFSKMDDTEIPEPMIDNKSTIETVHHKQNKKPSSEWIYIGSGFVYEPTEDDVGYFLKVTCDIGHVFPDQNIYIPCEFAESKRVVQTGPGICPFEKRQLETMNWAESGRIMTYNILADVYANRKSAMDYFYPYCAPYALSLDYRKQLFMREILGYKCDVICLQEVDQKVYHNDLETILTANGYSGEMNTRCKTLSQGEAIYFKADKFIHLGSHHVELTWSLLERNIHKDVLQKISENEMLKHAVEQRQTMLMLTALQPVDTPSKVLLLANTHLSCGARKANIRIVQTLTALQHINHVTKIFYREKDVSVVFCGDFNSLPESGVVKLLTNGEVSEKHADWFVGGRDEFVSGMTFKDFQPMKSAYENPYYTNYVSGFYGTIDYIFYDPEKLETMRTVSLPEHSDVIQDTACPSVKFPSDHLSLVCELKFVN